MLLSAGGQVDGQNDQLARFAVITYDTNMRKFVFFARQWISVISSYICQLRQGLYRYDDTVHCHWVYNAIVFFLNDVEFDLRWQQ